MGKRHDHAQNASNSKSIVEGVFKSNNKLNLILKDFDLDQDDEIIIRKKSVQVVNQDHLLTILQSKQKS